MAIPEGQCQDLSGSNCERIVGREHEDSFSHMKILHLLTETSQHLFPSRGNFYLWLPAEHVMSTPVVCCVVCKIAY